MSQGTFSVKLRAAIAGMEGSAYALAKRSGVDAATISRFSAGKQDICLATAERLAVALGLTFAAVDPEGQSR